MTNQEVLNRFVRLYEEVFSHDGYGEIRVEMKILRKGQKEVILHCGKQYRFVVDYASRQPLHWGVRKVTENTHATVGEARLHEKRRSERRQQHKTIDFSDRRGGGDRRERSKTDC